MRKIKNVWINRTRWYTIIFEMVTEEKNENVVGTEGGKQRGIFTQIKKMAEVKTGQKQRGGQETGQ